ncbi:MAG: class I SAM-dependent methyltransferase [Actinobacteria bacterium]|nr:class I SAM-dependent methyltransferase [Actinomycetota bacterium]
MTVGAGGMHAYATIAELAAAFGLEEAQAAALTRHADLMLAWRRGNVTALRTRAEIVNTLFGDALALLDVPQLRERASAGWLDLGAGAGIPGIPLAVALPAAELTLLDSASGKCAFLAAAVEAAGLAARATVVCARSEQHAAAGQPGREAYGVVLARAVAPLPALVELAAPLLARGGVLLASKTGRAVREEGPAGASAAKLCGLAAFPVVVLSRSPLDDAVCAVYEKVAAAPKRLPRREGQAVKHPLAR